MKSIITLLTVILICSAATAQVSSVSQHVEDTYKKNLIKVNLTSPILKNYSLQYEHIINKRVSFAISGRIMPAGTLPFKNTVINNVLKDEEITDNDLITQVADKVKFSNFAFTPEARFYLGRKGYGHGFYIAPYYRYATYKMHKTNISIEEEGNTTTYAIDLSGKIISHTGGFLLGAQWYLGKSLSVDVWVAGPNIGSGKGSITGVANQALNQDEQHELRRHLENIDIPFTKETIYVNANGAKMDLNGPWAGLRTGILLGLRF